MSVNRGQLALTHEDLHRLLNLDDSVTIAHVYCTDEPNEVRVVLVGPTLPSVHPRMHSPIVSLHLVARGAEAA